MRKYLAKLDWNDMLMNKTAIECWNMLKYENESFIDKFVPLKKQGKRSREKHLSKEAIKKIVFKPAVRKLWPAGQIWPAARFQLAHMTLPAI